MLRADCRPPNKSSSQGQTASKPGAIVRPVTEAGLLCQGAVDVDYSYFDTNIAPYQHFYVEGERLLIDIAGENIRVAGIPTLPAGTNFDRLDVVVRLKRGTRR